MKRERRGRRGVRLSVMLGMVSVFLFRVVFAVPAFPDDYVSSAVLKDSLARIVRKFGERLTAFRFPPRTERKDCWSV
jgi:hypothetical protein